MAEGTDQSQKTEEPTPKKLREAREKGQIASSREVNHWFMILAATIGVLAFAPTMFREMAVLLGRFIERPHTLGGAGGVGPALTDMLGGLLLIMLVPVALLLAAAIASGLVQNGFLLAAEQIRPKLERVSPLGGVKRLFSLKSFAEFLKGLLKLAIVGSVLFFLMLPEFDGLERLTALPPVDLLWQIYELVLRLLIGTVAVMTVLAGLDVFYQRFEYRKQMRMSRQEVKEEMKQSEGDPLIKSRIRQIRMERARRRMMAEVPDADVVVTNPTHYAVALKYDRDTMEAPRLVAKGVDSLARRIREIARENDVPLVENPPLAQALYAGVELDQEIPPEHYKAVAEVISYVFALKKRKV